MKFIDGGVCAPKGFLAAGIHCGIRKGKDKLDLALIFSKEQCNAASVYTTNKVKSAPIYVTKKNLENNKARAIICNSGIANACVSDGIEKAQRMCELAAIQLKIDQEEVIVASTGVIGQSLNISPIENSIADLADKLSVNGSDMAANAIMTTDTVKKEFAVQVEIDGKAVKLGGICKGSGMINPNMATMLAFITTDVYISDNMLKKALKNVCDKTFNCVSVDGDTSTNDMLSILANGNAENKLIDTENSDFDVFEKALLELCTALAKAIAKDGEGATKLLECVVVNSSSEQTARNLAKSVIMSPLVKTAFFGADANWGRILCALGYADSPLAVDKVDITLKSPMGSILVCKNGQGVEFSEDDAKLILLENEIVIYVDLNDGDKKGSAFGCDLSYDYVKINGDYRT